MATVTTPNPFSKQDIAVSHFVDAVNNLNEIKILSNDGFITNPNFGALIRTIDVDSGLTGGPYDIFGLAPSRTEDDKLWVGVRNNGTGSHYFRKFNTDTGDIEITIAITKGLGANQLDFPADITVDSDDNLYTIDLSILSLFSVSSAGTVRAHNWKPSIPASGTVSMTDPCLEYNEDRDTV